MFRKNAVYIMVVFLIMSFLATGCAAVLLGGGAVGGYALSQDSAEGYFDTSADRVWGASRDVLKEKGAVTSEDRKKGKMEATVDDVKVTAEIKELTSKTVKLKISARQNLMPKVKIAQDIYVRIAKKL